MDPQVEQFKAFSTTTISDALDRLGIAGQVFGITPLDRGFRMAGRAFTVRTIPVAKVKGAVGDYIDDVPAGEVVVLDNGGRPSATGICRRYNISKPAWSSRQCPARRTASPLTLALQVFL